MNAIASPSLTLVFASPPYRKKNGGEPTPPIFTPFSSPRQRISANRRRTERTELERT